MKYITYIIVCLLSINCALAQAEPEAFLPQLFINYPNVRDIAISPNGDEIYFTVDDIKSKIALISYIKKVNNNEWSKPKAALFSGKYRDLEPAFSPDGKRLYFVSNRPINKDSISPKDYDIWYVDKINTNWSSPKNIGFQINSKANEYYPSVTKNGDIYFTSERENGVGSEDIFVSRLKDGKYQKPTALGLGVNTKYYEFNAYISPNEEYLIFSALRPNEGIGGGDLYISYNKNNEWSKAKLLEKINTEYLDFCPFVDVENDKLYFTSQRSSVKKFYKKPLTLEQFLAIYGSKEAKGLNRLYSIDLSSVVQ